MRHPKILWPLCFAQGWKFFSHYGIRSLLLLFMTKSLGFSDDQAFGTSAMFCGLIELGAIFGGILADRYLGLRQALLLGGWFLALGYSLLLFENNLFLSLGLIILGGSLFSGNITALLGAAYPDDDPKREKGFTIFYMMQNLGALASIVICSVVQAYFGFPTAFLVAASGMVLGNGILFLCRSHLSSQKVVRKRSFLIPLLACALIMGSGVLLLKYQEIFLPILPWVTCGLFLFFALKLLNDPNFPKLLIKKLLVYLGSLILFFAAQDQICSSLIIFTERQAERTVLGWTVPSSIIMSINPVVILLFGTIISRVRSWLLSPFIILSASFASLSLLCFLHLDLSIFGVLGIVMAMSLAELMVGPYVTSFASCVAAKGSPGMVMGMVPIGFSLAFFLGGYFSKMVAVEDLSSSLATYATGYGKIALLSFFGGIALYFFMKKLCRSDRQKAAEANLIK